MNQVNLRKQVFLFGLSILVLGFAFPTIVSSTVIKPKANLRFGISFPREQSQEALDGRMLLMISTDGANEPRFQISSGPNTQLIFGIDVDGLPPDEAAIIDRCVFGFPLDSISEIPPGEYWVQGLLHRYETFHRADGHTVKLPMDRGEGQKWNRAPGNLYSTPKKVRIDPQKNDTIKISLDQEIPPFPEPEDTKYLKHVRIQSKLLTEFWGRPMHLGAIVLLPEGFEEHTEARYPLMIMHGHFNRAFDLPGGFLETPPDLNKPGLSVREKLYQKASHQLYKDWTAPDFPRMLLITIQHANPYFDDSYAVNSANVGPYGDAITYELIPFIEKKFRGIGQGWARVMYGGSAGGWEVLASQIFYPDEYNGVAACCPDPVDFRAYEIVNIYDHKNAYYYDSRWKRTPRPGLRNAIGEISATLIEQEHLALVLGTKCRSGDWRDMWNAAFGPVGEDGYPKPLWDKRTGEIDHSIAEYWRENYDLRHILERDWATLGPKLVGKIHIYTGDMDSWYQNNAVYLMEDFLESTNNPYYHGIVDYGDRQVHCWAGDHNNPISVQRLTYTQRFAPMFVEHMLKTAPPGADVSSWRY